MLESAKRKGCPRTWVEPFLTQLEQFPAGEHDEMVDCFTQAVTYLRDTGHLENVTVPDDEIEEIDYNERRKALVNPYA